MSTDHIALCPLHIKWVLESMFTKLSTEMTTVGIFDQKINR